MKDLDSLLKTFQDEENFHREDPGTEEIVFVHDCYHKVNGKVYEFTDQEYGVLTNLLESTQLPQNSYQFIPAIKSFDVREDDISTAQMAKHREILYEDLESVSPSLVIPLGNMAMKAVLKKSGITNKRGREFKLSLGEDNDVSVIPTFHPVSLYLEPKLRTLFLQDIDNAYTKVILDENKLRDTAYKVCMSMGEVEECMSKSSTHDVIAVDLETEGLDYKKDNILTIGISYAKGEAFVIPVFHNESPFSPSEIDRIRELLTECMKSSQAKVFHNCKFDLKFLMNFGVPTFSNIEDTQVMHALIDENKPHALMDVVKEYFPEQLEKF